MQKSNTHTVIAYTLRALELKQRTYHFKSLPQQPKLVSLPIKAAVEVTDIMTVAPKCLKAAIRSTCRKPWQIVRISCIRDSYIVLQSTQGGSYWTPWFTHPGVTKFFIMVLGRGGCNVLTLLLTLKLILSVHALAPDLRVQSFQQKPSANWKPIWQNRGSYDAVMCEGTPFFWTDKRMYLMECVCTGPLDKAGWGNPYGFYWGHAEQWNRTYLNHSYIRIRDLETGDVVSNISTSIGFGFGAAFVDYDNGMLWISATANDRVSNAKRPYGPPTDFCPHVKHWECNGVWVFNSSDLRTWTRRQTDVKWNGPNTDIARVYHSPDHPTPSNLPPHRYVMATERGVWAVNNNANGDLSTGWITLHSSRAHGGSLACPSVRYLPSDGYYYTVSGGHVVELMRSKDLLTWETSKGPASPFIQASPGDIRVASDIMHSAASNLRKGHANRSFPHRAEWDLDANDADLCCESWGGAAPEKGGPSGSYVLWGADGQGSSGFKDGPEGFAAIGVSNMTLEKLLQSYFWWYIPMIARLFQQHVAKLAIINSRMCRSFCNVWIPGNVSFIGVIMISLHCKMKSYRSN